MLPGPCPDQPSKRPVPGRTFGESAGPLPWARHHDAHRLYRPGGHRDDTPFPTGSGHPPGLRDDMPLTQSDAIEVKRVRGKGRGVFARRPIGAGEVIETCPVLVLPAGSIEDVSAGIGRLCLRMGPGQAGAGPGLRLAVQPLVPAQRPLRGSGRADQAVHGDPGHRSGRGDHGQLQRRAGG